MAAGMPARFSSPPGTSGEGGVGGPGGECGAGVPGVGCDGIGPVTAFPVTGVILHPARRIIAMRITAAAGNPDLMNGNSATWYL
jgi:hypothetical protein